MPQIQERYENDENMRCVQINLNNCEIAQDLLRQTVTEKQIDLAIISEPYRTLDGCTWVMDNTNKASIWACGRLPFQEVAVHEEAGYVVARVNGVYVFSCYAPPSLTLPEFQRLISKIATDARRYKPNIIAGDFNAWAEEWGSRLTNARGESLLETFAGLDLVLVNAGDTTTFRGTGGCSIIDLTFATPALAKDMLWSVSEDYTNSDHQAILFEIHKSNTRSGNRGLARQKGWIANTMEADTVAEMMREVNMPEGTAEERARFVTRKLTAACDASMAKRRVNNRREPVYWWNDKVRELRSKCHKARRRSQRTTGSASYEEERRKYTEARNDLRCEIRRSKKQCFKDLCDEADANPWGSAYRVVMAKVKGRRAPTEKCPVLLKTIIETLFPHQDPWWTLAETPTENANVPTVTVDEIICACRKVGEKKAPGPDEIPNGALKTAIECNPSLFAELMQACLEEGTFPREWKRQKLVLLPKAGKLPGDPSAYRPICLLDTIGKVLERIVQSRLTQFSEGERPLSEHQFGFRKARSTLDAIDMVVSIAREATAGKRWKGGTMKYCVIITLDVKNAFNTANWGQIMRALQGMGVPEYLLKIIGDYLSYRVLTYDTEDGPKEYQVTGGVPQGSVLGPILWNIMYDGVLRLELPNGARTVGFADDLAIVVTAKHLDEVEMVASESVATVRRWINSAGLALADHKTEVLLVSKRKQMEKATVRVGDHTVESKDEIKYLGVTLDSRLSFRAHVKHACEKAAKRYTGLARMLANTGGPRSSRRLLLARVITSTLLYGAQIWAEALKLQHNRRTMQSVHRLTAIRVTSAYRTVSSDAVCVIAGMKPIDVAADEAKRMFEAKRNGATTREARNREETASMQVWQERWNASQKGRWTHKLIPDIKKWTTRSHGEVNYHLTQFLTGHGGYRSYLHRFGHDDSPLCPLCGVEEDAEHVLFRCPRFREDREELPRATNGTTEAEDLVEEMLRSQEAWNTVCSVIRRINEKLRAIEAIRRANTDGL